MVLKINEESDSIISELMVLGLSEYFRFVADKLDCNIDDLCYLEVHDDWKEEDKEGWSTCSFFPKGTKMGIATIHDESEGKVVVEIPTFSMGVIKEIVVNGKVFYGDCNASPMGIITKREGLW